MFSVLASLVPGLNCLQRNFHCNNNSPRYAAVLFMNPIVLCIILYFTLMLYTCKEHASECQSKILS
ncbi:hypothetical protein Pint_11510 [Pistacia integerrima]|uniref:Uncharacterized protein n=1 Tax=Pistacia integerrima TaxID=434235 RepID=A0ACC0XIZ8_9ROSI|nr:hypothetical protein Pint_11510 [Pistacia integerrima]